jgi:biofilm PGA synthesis lipoprotein PgaB
MEAVVLMIKRVLFIISMFLFIGLSCSVANSAMKPGEFLVLCYHAVTVRPSPGNMMNISQNNFAEQIEYLRTHGYEPVSLDDILKAREGKKKLPERAVLLTFDDAYISYYEFVVPLLEELGYPSVLAVVGKFIDDPPEDLPEPLMNWEQIKEVSSHKLVDVVSHTSDLHKGIQYSSPGNIGSAVNVLAFDPDSKTYETRTCSAESLVLPRGRWSGRMENIVP